MEKQRLRSRKPKLTAVGFVVLTTRHLYPQKLALTSPTSGGRSVGIVRLRTKAKQCVCLLYIGVFLVFLNSFVRI
jgi:hypothetical protein